MTELSYKHKILLQVEENQKNIERSKQALEAHGIDTAYTMGDALDLFKAKHGFNSKDERLNFHDAMHIAGLHLGVTAREEAREAVTEHALLRESYNGITKNDLDPQGFVPKHLLRKFNGEGQQDFSPPAILGAFQDAASLAQERLQIVNKIAYRQETVSMPELRSAYTQAEKTDAFFQALMGGRAIYQLSLKELLQTPVAFFGVIKTGQPDDLSFDRIPAATQQALIDELSQTNTVIHEIDTFRTVAALLEQYPQAHHLVAEQTEPSTLTAE